MTNAEGFETYILNNASDATSKRLAQLEKGIPLWLQSPLTGLIQTNRGGVVGATVEHEGKLKEMRETLLAVLAEPPATEAAPARRTARVRASVAAE